jgi:hypothetical protein
MKKMEFKVTLTVVDDARFADAKDYILEAAETWGGQRHPDDPFFNMHGRVKVARITKKATQ